MQNVVSFLAFVLFVQSALVALSYIFSAWPVYISILPTALVFLLSGGGLCAVLNKQARWIETYIVFNWIVFPATVLVSTFSMESCTMMDEYNQYLRSAA